ncbi:hypothetical protein [Roseospira navarrensis]|uniref:Orn/DAP/Arg decarboxylase 2 N-terminal domain-containing protein n=1 Tax=Roseospira navarrensis TaxID=140058 RepID=A0A7X1ZFT3_9PROT|nr:hypothetical protein [Roseospira navarrensis]MQX37557.1 hypothetical protein [Roseospira navarrensis]
MPPAPALSPPPEVLNRAAHLEAPAFLLHRPTLVARLSALRAAWDAYAYPVKAQPHPDALAAAVALGLDLDVCGSEELDAALATGAEGHRITWTSPWGDAALFDRLASLGARAYLDSLDQVALWSARHPGRGAGLRLSAGPGTYGEKFGLAVADLPAALTHLRAAGCSLTGLHAHASVTAPDDPDELAAPALDVLAGAVGALDEPPATLRISLGGGWPVRPLTESAPSLGTALLEAARARLAEPLRQRGCTVTLAVEVGEHVLAPAGVYVARVAAVHDRAERRVVVLAAPWVVAPRYEDYPVGFFRPGRDGLHPLDTAPGPTTVYGASNGPADVVSRGAPLPRPQIGDLAIIGHCGAYLSTLMAPFNGRSMPPMLMVDESPAP